MYFSYLNGFIEVFFRKHIQVMFWPHSRKNKWERSRVLRGAFSTLERRGARVEARIT